MGVHIHIVNPQIFLTEFDRAYWPGWEFPANGGHRELDRALGEVLKVEYYKSKSGDDAFWTFVRPVDFPAFRAFTQALNSNPELFAEMADVLEQNPDYWLYVSR